MQKKLYFCTVKHIRIISPSGAIDPVYMDGAAERLRRWGYQVSEGLFARGRYGRFAATAEDRLHDIQDALSDPNVDAVLCSRGGYGLQQIIDRLPAIASPKPIIGFSDITELHQWSLLNGGVSLHGLMCKHLTELDESADPIRYWQQALAGETLNYTQPAHPLNRCGEAQGTLIGGNLSVLYGLQATPYSLANVMTKGGDYILFIEDIGERHYHIDRMMHNLKMSGVLARLAGLVVGQFSDCEDDSSMSCNVYETIRRMVDEYDYPVWIDFPAGHVSYNLPLWFGKPTRLKVTSQVCNLQQ